MVLRLPENVQCIVLQKRKMNATEVVASAGSHELKMGIGNFIAQLQ